MMEHRDTEIRETFDSEPEKNNFDNEYSPLKKKAKFGSHHSEGSDKVPYTKFAIGFFILMILLILLFIRNRNTVLEERVTRLENLAGTLEERVVKFEAIDESVAKIWEQAQSFEQFKDRFERAEVSIMSRMDQISKNLDRLQKGAAKAKIKKAESSKTVKATKKAAQKRYHIVKSGETIYGISRKYGITMKKLRLLNHFSDKTSIHPGQKLIVGP